LKNRRNKMEIKRKIEIQPLVELGLFLFALLGTIIPLHIHLDNKMDNRMEISRKETNEIINAIRMDIKDFHEKLIRIEERKEK